MTQHQHHEDLVKGITEQLKPVMGKSAQAIFVYLDDNHKACNKKYADLLGYKSAKEWADTDAPLADVIEKDQPKVISAYEKAMQTMAASSLNVTAKHIETGELIKTRLILVPIAYNGHLFSLNFFSKI